MPKAKPSESPVAASGFVPPKLERIAKPSRRDTLPYTKTVISVDQQAFFIYSSNEPRAVINAAIQYEEKRAMSAAANAAASKNSKTAK